MWVMRKKAVKDGSTIFDFSNQKDEFAIKSDKMAFCGVNFVEGERFIQF